MSKVQRFEELIAWQKARELAKQIYLLSRQEKFSKDFGLCSQIQRAAVSIMANLAEGFERGSSAEFHQFIVIAKASCAEVRSHLYVALDVGYLESGKFEQVNKLAEEAARIIGGLKVAVGEKRGRK